MPNQPTMIYERSSQRGVEGNDIIAFHVESACPPYSFLRRTSNHKECPPQEEEEEGEITHLMRMDG